MKILAFLMIALKVFELILGLLEKFLNKKINTIDSDFENFEELENGEIGTTEVLPVTDIDDKIDTLVQNMQQKYEQELLVEDEVALLDGVGAETMSDENLMGNTLNVNNLMITADTVDEMNAWELEDEDEKVAQVTTIASIRPTLPMTTIHQNNFSKQSLRQALKWQVMLERRGNKKRQY